MKTRKDGEATREIILETACRIFGDLGYHKATHAQICAEAGVNTSLINFHFGSKEDLYLAVWQRISQEMEQIYPLDGGLSSSALPSLRLEKFIRTLLSRALDPEMKGFHNIRMVEAINPTGILNVELEEDHRRHREHLTGIIRDLLGDYANEENILFCEMSVIGLCHMLHPRPCREDKGPFHCFNFSDVDRMTRNIYTFALAGIQAIRDKSQAKTEGTTKP